MRHLSEGELQSWVDAELDDASRASADQHLADCAACRAALGVLRAAGETFSLAMHVHDGEIAALQTSEPRRASVLARRGTFGLGRAAAIVLLAAAGAAAVVPGGPLRSLWDEAPDAVTVPDELPRVSMHETGAAGASITVHPVDGRLSVDVVGFPQGTVVVAARTDRVSAVASLPAWAENARFIVSSGRLRIVAAENSRGAMEAEPIRLWLPASLGEGNIAIDGDPVARVSGGAMSSLDAASNSAGEEVSFTVGG